MVEATKRRTGRRAVGRAVKVWMSVVTSGRAAYFIKINWIECEQEMGLAQGLRANNKRGPLMEEMTRRNCEKTRAHSRLEYAHLGED